MTSVGDPMVGQVLDGRYQITARLARGGMATVYQAVDMRLTRTVAVKVMHIGLGDDAEFARKFDREARAAARLSHPNVVSVFDQGHDHGSEGGGRPYIVMEYVDGQTLRDVISRDAPLTPLRALEMIMIDESTREYVLFDRHLPSSWIWRKMAGPRVAVLPTR